ncbi:MAG: hypothetical protein FWC39_11120 [Bacteroidetes bacterium]|nr:hypothetical protein [Bacteroidota bacterium]
MTTITKEAPVKQSLSKGKKVSEKPKSKTTLFWEKNPNGIGSTIINMRAVLR